MVAKTGYQWELQARISFADPLVVQMCRSSSSTLRSETLSRMHGRALEQLPKPITNSNGH